MKQKKVRTRKQTALRRLGQLFTVVVIVAKDGTEQVVRTSSVSENGVVVKLESDATVKVVDMSRDFKDVHPVNHWATDAIDFVSARGIFNGTSSDTNNSS